MVVTMFLRVSQAKQKAGIARYVQLVHNVRDAKTGQTRA